MVQDIYLMESDEESHRLDIKTDPRDVEKQARWAGIEPGMRVADLGCGAGKTTSLLNREVLPGGSAVGVDISEARIAYARSHYAAPTIEFTCRDIRKPLDDLGLFDLVWIRFVLEYHRSCSIDIVRNAAKILKPGGILCLIDLDCNCLIHFGMSDRLMRSLNGLMNAVEKEADFDPYVGRKLYSFLYDLGFDGIEVRMAPHHLIYGELKASDEYNWTQKVAVAGRKSGYRFPEFPNGYEGFYREFSTFFKDQRRFTYTPLIFCLGRRPLND